jgi:hypothetical protein
MAPDKAPMSLLGVTKTPRALRECFRLRPRLNRRESFSFTPLCVSSLVVAARVALSCSYSTEYSYRYQRFTCTSTIYLAVRLVEPDRDAGLASLVEKDNANDLVEFKFKCCKLSNRTAVFSPRPDLLGFFLHLYPNKTSFVERAARPAVLVFRLTAAGGEVARHVATPISID